MFASKENLFMKFKYQQNDESFQTIDSKYKLCVAIKCDQNVEEAVHSRLFHSLLDFKIHFTFPSPFSLLPFAFFPIRIHDGRL